MAIIPPCERAEFSALHCHCPTWRRAHRPGALFRDLKMRDSLARFLTQEAGKIHDNPSDSCHPEQRDAQRQALPYAHAAPPSGQGPRLSAAPDSASAGAVKTTREGKNMQWEQDEAGIIALPVSMWAMLGAPQGLALALDVVPSQEAFQSGERQRYQIAMTRDQAIELGRALIEAAQKPYISPKGKSGAPQ